MTDSLGKVVASIAGWCVTLMFLGFIMRLNWMLFMFGWGLLS